MASGRVLKKGSRFLLASQTDNIWSPQNRKKGGGGAPPPFQAIRPWLEDIVFRKRSRNVTSYK